MAIKASLETYPPLPAPVPDNTAAGSGRSCSGGLPPLRRTNTEFSNPGVKARLYVSPKMARRESVPSGSTEDRSSLRQRMRCRSIGRRCIGSSDDLVRDFPGEAMARAPARLGVGFNEVRREKAAG